MLPLSTWLAIPTLLRRRASPHIVGSTYNAQLKTDADAIKYYEVILATKTEDGTANEVLKVKATDTALLNTLIASSNYGKLFYIETTGGYVSGVQKVGVVDSTTLGALRIPPITSCTATSSTTTRLTPAMLLATTTRRSRTLPMATTS